MYPPTGATAFPHRFVLNGKPVEARPPGSVLFRVRFEALPEKPRNPSAWQPEPETESEAVSEERSLPQEVVDKLLGREEPPPIDVQPVSVEIASDTPS